jgi:hypothetical protein
MDAIITAHHQTAQDLLDIPRTDGDISSCSDPPAMNVIRWFFRFALRVVLADKRLDRLVSFGRIPYQNNVYTRLIRSLYSLQMLIPKYTDYCVRKVNVVVFTAMCESPEIVSEGAMVVMMFYSVSLISLLFIYAAFILLP